MSDRFIRTEGIELFVRELGHAATPPLVMVHGGPDWDHSYLLPAAERLAERRRVVLFDLRGCGRSSRCANLADYSRDAAARDILAVVRAVDTSAHLLGFSFGGRLALRAAQLESRRVRSLILASSTTRARAHWDDEPTERRRRRQQVPTLGDVLSRRDLDDAAKTRTLALEGLPLGVWDLAELPRIRRVIERVTFSGEWGRAWTAGLFAPAAGDYDSWLRSAELPTLILHGRQDYNFPVEHGESFADAPHVRRVILEDTGHLAPLERTDAWCRAVGDFLDDLDARH